MSYESDNQGQSVLTIKNNELGHELYYLVFSQVIFDEISTDLSFVNLKVNN